MKRNSAVENKLQELRTQGNCEMFNLSKSNARVNCKCIPCKHGRFWIRTKFQNMRKTMRINATIRKERTTNHHQNVIGYLYGAASARHTTK